MHTLDDIRRACDRLRHYPESRWQQAPRAPLGARSPQQLPRSEGESLVLQVSSAIVALMQADAKVRRVPSFAPGVSVFSLPDVLEALARSVAGNGDAVAQTALQEVAARARDW